MLTQPLGWMSSNFAIFSGAPESITQEIGFDGGKACGIRTVSYIDNGIDITESAFLISAQNMMNLEMKFPLEGIPVKLKGKYKFNPVQGDSFSVVMMVYRNGMVTGEAMFISAVQQPAYTDFEVPFIYFGSAMGDSATIVILSSANEEPHSGTYLVVDALELEYSGLNSVTQPGTFSGKIYPNPAAGKITLETSEASMQRVVLTDVNGRILKTEEMSEGEMSKTIDLSDLNPGLILGRVEYADRVESIRFIRQ